MAHAEKCPVCGGKGEIDDPIDDSSFYPTHASKKTCHGCGGKGWVVVPDERHYYKPPETTGGI